MRIEIFIEQHERFEALEAYGKYLSVEQRDQVAEHEGRVKLDIDMRLGHSFVELLSD